MRRALAQLAALSPRESVVLAQLVTAAGACRAALVAVPLDRLSQVAAVMADGRWLPVGSTGLAQERLADLADLAARLTGRRTRCLVRSLILFVLLRGRGEAVTLVVGVARGPAGLHGHAWIERGTEVVGETLPEGVFTTFLRLDGAGPR